MTGEQAVYDADGNMQDDRAVRLRAIDEVRRIVESKAKLNRLGEKPKDDDGVAPMTVRIVGIDPADLV